MRHKITLQTQPPAVDEQNLLDSRSKPAFIVGAESDYVLSRILLLLGMNDPGMYHYQQCMVKYLKAVLIDNDVQFENTHNLELLRSRCEPLDEFFSDEDLSEACQKVWRFEVIGRYPQTQIRAYGWTMPDLVNFLDEFVHIMRKKVNHQS